MVEVTQEDREAAAAFWIAYCGNNPLAWERLPPSSQEETASAFARHRIATEQRTEQRARIEGFNEGIEAAAEWFADRFSEAVQADCENGVRWLNERAAAAYLKDAPDTLAAIREGEEAIRALAKPMKGPTDDT